MRDGGRRRFRAIGLEAACAAAPLAAGAWFYGTRWLGTFPLIEFRNWLAYPFTRGTLPELAGNLAARDIPFSRDVSLFSVQLIAAGCGIDVACINAVPIAFLLASGVLLYVLVRALLGSRALACGTAVLWIFSRPVTDAVSWQATNHDKVAVLFSLSALDVAVWFLRRPATGLRLVAGNLALGLLVVLAYNSKEAAWGLVPCLVLLGFVAVPGTTPSTWARQQLPLLLLPLVYGVHQNTRYFEHFQEDLPWKIHVTTGPPVRNMKIYLGLLANDSASSPEAILPYAALVAGAILAFAWDRRRPNPNPAVARCARVALWAACGWALSVGLVLRLLYPSPYHMLVPSAYLYVLGAAALALLGDAAATPPARIASAAVAWSTGALLALHAARTYHEYQTLHDRSEHFKERLAELARHVPVAGREPIYLVSDDSRYDAYMYLGDTGARDVYQYAYRDRSPNPEFEGRYRELRRSAFDALPAREARAYYVVFDADMRLVEIDRGGEVLYRQP